MSDEKKDLTGENVHGIKDGVDWSRFHSWDKNWGKKEEPKVAEPEPVVEAEFLSPAPLPVPEPEPVADSVWPPKEKINKMAAHLRKVEKMKISMDEAKDMLRSCEKTKEKYKLLEISGKF